MAPEVLEIPIGEKEGSFGTKADVFSLGSVIYFLAFKRQAFRAAEGRGDEAVREKLLLNERCPPELVDVIRQCWRQQPAYRPSSNRIFELLHAVPLPPEPQTERIDDEIGMKDVGTAELQEALKLAKEREQQLMAKLEAMEKNFQAFENNERILQGKEKEIEALTRKLDEATEKEQKALKQIEDQQKALAASERRLEKMGVKTQLASTERELRRQNSSLRHSAKSPQEEKEPNLVAAVEEQVQMVRQLVKEASPFVQTLKSEEERLAAFDALAALDKLGLQVITCATEAGLRPEDYEAQQLFVAKQREMVMAFQKAVVMTTANTMRGGGIFVATEGVLKEALKFMESTVKEEEASDHLNKLSDEENALVTAHAMVEKIDSIFFQENASKIRSASDPRPLANELVVSINAFTMLLRKVADKADGEKFKLLLAEFANIIRDRALQVKIIIAVEARQTDSFEQVIKRANGLKENIKQVLEVLCAASVKKLLAATINQVAAIKRVVDAWKKARALSSEPTRIDSVVTKPIDVNLPSAITFYDAGQLNPMDVAVDSERGLVAIAMVTCIRIHSLGGALIREIGPKGQGFEITNGRGVAIDPYTGNILFVYCQKNVLIFSPSGNLVRSIGEDQEDAVLQGVSVDPSNGNILVADFATNSIKIFSQDGKLVQKIGGVKGSGDGQLNVPAHAVVNGSEIYVADFGNNRVCVFGKDGRFHRHLLMEGKNGPRRLAVDPANGNVFIAEYGNNQVQIISSSGTRIKAISTAGETTGVGLDFRDNSVFAATSQGRKVQRFCK